MAAYKPEIHRLHPDASFRGAGGLSPPPPKEKEKKERKKKKEKKEKKEKKKERNYKRRQITTHIPIFQ